VDTVSPAIRKHAIMEKMFSVWFARGGRAIEMWCERWNNIIEDRTQAIYFSHRLRSDEAHLTLN
jgi:hypothetical protein